MDSGEGWGSFILSGRLATSRGRKVGAVHQDPCLPIEDAPRSAQNASAAPTTTAPSG